MLMSSLILQVACTAGTTGDSSPVLETVEPTTSILEGVEIVETIPPTAEGDEPEPLNAPGPRRGGVLAAPLVWCKIPDPAIDGAVEASSIISLPLVPEIHAGLMKLSDDPNAPIQLELADSYNVKENGLAYEFILRQDLKFSDGTPLTASDVKWSWERALDKSVVGGKARDIFGFVEGTEALVEGASDELTGVVVVDDRTLQVQLMQPRAEFVTLLADPVASVLKKENALVWNSYWQNALGYVESITLNKNDLTVGAGPFKLIEYRGGSGPGSGSCSIARNPHYWGRPAYLDGVWFRPEVMKREVDSSRGTVMNIVADDPMAFVSEETDFERTHQLDSETAELIEVDGAKASNYRGSPIISFLMLNPTAPPFDDIHFRRAVVASADTGSITRSSLKDRRLITDDLTTLELFDVHAGFDLEMARAELVRSKYADHVEDWDIGYLWPDTFAIMFEIEKLFSTWNQVLNLSIKEHRSRSGAPNEMDGPASNKLHFRMFHEVPVFPDPVAVLRAIVSPFGDTDKAPEFLKIEEMLQAAATESDAVKRHEMYIEIEKYLADQALVIPIEVIAGSVSYRTQPWVHDLKPPKFPGSTFYNVWLDARAPKRELPTP